MLNMPTIDQYIDWKISNVMPIKNKYGYRVTLISASGEKTVQQKSGFSTQKEANNARNITIGELYSGTYVIVSNITVEEYFEWWLEEYVKKHIGTYNTYMTYRNAVRNHIVPNLRKKKLIQVDRGDIQELYNVITAISVNEVRIVKTVINVSMKFAVAQKILPVNPADGVLLPKTIDKKPYRIRTIDSQKTLRLDQLYILIEASKSTPIYLQVLFNTLMGLRRSEIIGLKYSDINYIDQTITIKRQLGRKVDMGKDSCKRKILTKQEIQLKTPSSYRTLKIPEYVFQAILEQRKIYEKNRNRRKQEFQDDDFICCSTYGHSRSKDFHYKYFKKILEENNLPNIRWHDLRSSYCTLLLKMNFSPKAVSNLMGHAKELITIDVYGDNAQLVSDNTDALDEFMKEIFTEDSKNEYLKEIQEIDPDFDIDCEAERMFGFFDCSPIL